MKQTDGLPELTEVLIRRECSALADVNGEVCRSLNALDLALAPGATVAIAVGSRGVANLAEIVQAVVEFVVSFGAEPFVVPAMGSHGGGTADGQREVLHSYGIREEYIGAPIRSSMEVVELPNGGIGNRVFMDRCAYEADGVIVINRIKPHTDYHEFPESGLLKMATIGLGKHQQALEIHKRGIEGLRTRILPTARQVLASGHILAGVAVIENANDETMLVRAVAPENFETAERELLSRAERNMARIATEQADLLIIDEMGKDISGVGVDTNVIGRIRVPGQEEPPGPRFASIVVSDLTDASHGNAIGMGLADVVTRRLADKVNYETTYENVVTSSFLERGKLPVVAESDEAAIRIALRGAAVHDWSRARIVRIRNTLHPYRLMVSPAVLEEMIAQPGVEVVTQSLPLVDSSGCLSAWS